MATPDLNHDGIVDGIDVLLEGRAEIAENVEVTETLAPGVVSAPKKVVERPEKSTYSVMVETELSKKQLKDKETAKQAAYDADGAKVVRRAEAVTARDAYIGKDYSKSFAKPAEVHVVANNRSENIF